MQDDRADEWRRLQNEQIQLRLSLASASSDDERNELIQRARAIKATLDELDRTPAVASADDPPSPAQPQPTDIDALLAELLNGPEPDHTPGSISQNGNGSHRGLNGQADHPTADDPADFAATSARPGETPPTADDHTATDASPPGDTSATTDEPTATDDDAGGGDTPPSTDTPRTTDDVDIMSAGIGGRRGPSLLVALGVMVAVIGLVAGSIRLVGGLLDETGPDESNGVALAPADDAATAGLALDSAEPAPTPSAAEVAPGSQPASPPNPDAPILRVGLVAPGAVDDGSFTQSMADGLSLVADGRGNVEVEIAENIGTANADATIRSFANRDFDLVIVHSSAFMNMVRAIADDHPEVTFAVGTVRSPSGQANVYTYAMAAEEAGYVFGALAAQLTESNVVGAVGPVELGTARHYIDGFRAGAHAESQDVTVLVSYTGSFSDGEAAASATRQQTSAGADLITGHGHTMGPAMAAAEADGARWLATQVGPNASPAGPTVAAAQVYRWDIGLRTIISDIDGDSIDGRGLVWIGDVANGGIAFDLGAQLDPADPTRQRFDAVVAAIVAGSIDP